MGLQAQAVDAGRGQDDGIIVARQRLADARVNIAAQRQQQQVGPGVQQLRPTPQAGGADARALWAGCRVSNSAPRSAHRVDFRAPASPQSPGLGILDRQIF
jgi:hypothetical protein